MIANAQRYSPDRMDPTRTMGLRRQFLADIRRRFRRVRQRVRELVLEQDAFGLVENELLANCGRAITNASYFAECERDARGRCESMGGGAHDSTDPDSVPKVKDALPKTEHAALMRFVRGEHLTGHYQPDDDPAFTSAIQKLPTVEAPIHRGTSMTEEQIAALKPGTAVSFSGHRSFTKSPEFAIDWAERHASEGKKPVVFTTETEHARDLGDLNPLQREVIVPKGVKKSVAFVHDMGRYISVTLNCGGPGGTYGPCPTGKALTAIQDRKAGSILARLRNAPAALVAKVQAKVSEKYASLSKRYGTRYAKAIIGAAVLGVPLPIPGSSFLTALPVLAVAEMHRRFSGVKAEVATNAEAMTQEQIDEAARRLIIELHRELRPARNVANASFFETCERDAHGRCVASTGRQSLEFSGTKERIFVDAKQLPHERTWLDQPHEKSVEATFDLDPENKTVYFNRIDALKSGKGYAREVADHVMDKLASAGYERMTAYVQFTDQASQSMMAKLGGVPGKETSAGRYWHFDLTKRRTVANALNPRFEFMSTPDAIAAFQKWLAKLLASELIGRSEDEIWRKYIEQGFKKGVGRSWDDVRQSQLRRERPELFLPENQDSLRDFYEGSKEEFLRSAFGRPVGIEKVKTLASRTFTDIKGVTDSVAVRMSRTLTDGLIQGQHSREVTKALAEDLDWALPRAERVARTEISRAYVEGQLDALEQMGVEELGVMVEWSTAMDSEVCPQCEPLEGVVLKIEEARGMFPRHPNCRCALIPANLGEDDENQKRGKADIEDAFEESGLDKTVSKRRPQHLLKE